MDRPIASPRRVKTKKSVSSSEKLLSVCPKHSPSDAVLRTHRDRLKDRPYDVGATTRSNQSGKGAKSESLGGVESFVAHPATMTHAAMDEDARHTAGITDGLVRLSVGIEDIRDLTDDLARALDRVAVRPHAPNVRFRSIEPERPSKAPVSIP